MLLVVICMQGSECWNMEILLYNGCKDKEGSASMGNKGVLTKILAIAGTIFTGFPIVAPIVFSIVSLLSDGVFRFDYLMPAELFLFALAGGAFLFWAALRARLWSKWIGLSLGIGMLAFFACQGLAVATGLASGATKAGGWQWTLVLTALILYILAVVGLFVGGCLLLRDLFKRKETIHPD
jgi:hypothetical protein